MELSKLKFLFFVVLLSGSLGAYAQAGVAIKGVVRDKSSGTTLPNATLQLKDGHGGVVQGASDENGAFAFVDRKPGKYELITTYTSYRADTLRLELKKDTLLEVGLVASDNQLAEVVIRSVIPPATVRNDTIAFNARAYKTRRNAPVEELLRMLPGVEVDKDGNVTIQGQKVDKVLIDGKTFFIDDLRKATKNLSAEIIAQVQVFDSQGDQARQAGITEQSTTKTINLKLKPDKKNNLVGKVYAGWGNDGGYAAGGTLTRISADQLLSVETNANNSNNQFTGTEHNNGGGAGKQQTGTVGINYRKDFSKKLTVTAYGSYNSGANSLQSSLQRQTFLKDSTLLEKQAAGSSSSQKNFAAGTRLEYKPDERTFVDYSFSWSSVRGANNSLDSTLIRTQKPDTAYTGSIGNNRNDSRTQGYTLQNELSFTHRFLKERRSLILSFSQSLSSQSQQAGIYTRLETYQPTGVQLVDQRQENPVQNQNYAAHVTYQEPLGRLFNLDLSYSWNQGNNLSQKHSADLDPATGQYDLPDTLTSNDFNNRVTMQQLRATLSNVADGKLHYSFSLGGLSTNQENDNRSSGLETDRTYLNWSPAAHLSYKLKGKLLRFWYQGQSQSPSIEQLQPLPDLSNPYLVKLGNADLRQSFSHELNANYSIFNSENARNLQLNVQGELEQHQISAATTALAGGVQQLQYVNLDGVYRVGAGVTYGFPLVSQDHGSGSIGGHLDYGHDRNVINGQDNTTFKKGASGDLALNYHSGNWLFIRGNASFGYQGNRYALLNEAASVSWLQQYGLAVDCTLPFAVSTGLQYAIQVNSTSNLPGQQSNLLNAFVAYAPLKGHAAQLRLSGFNLLDTSSAISQSAGPNFLETTTSNQSRRLVLLSLVYNFSEFYKGG